MILAPLLAAVLTAGPIAPPEEPASKAPPKVGEKAPDFRLPELNAEKPVTLSKIAADGPVVLLVLRGYPGYQCPICTRQIGAYLQRADEFKSAGARVVMIYPGPEEKLQTFAREFAAELKLPDGFTFLLDPGYSFTNDYRLRWDAPRETAYPSTFVLASDRTVSFAKVSDSHAGRTKPEEALAALKAMKK
ncbi:peroxiredoxin family protein [Alienimonas californiensis]|uniref:thioredoxin-dependent peroxiredoxin n=1 Tax=Alienimonas californiensis TaxID=2527989 RepID=A0A517P9A5_9PLAN|nr:peroxiredoxin family protein [Alienimonas californiensis]QDT15963.1 thioredoxin-dependent thiol peroxidase [Alienimonas californiensis]